MSKKTIYFLTFVLPVAADQLTKRLAVRYLKGQGSIVLIPGVLEFRYLENNGAAFSMLRGRQWFFYILTAVFLTAAIQFLRKMPDSERMRPLRFTVLLLMSGAVGNFIDRLFFRYVVDFIYFSLIDFPVFNVADICVTLSVASLILQILFRYRDDDFAFLSFSFSPKDLKKQDKAR